MSQLIFSGLATWSFNGRCFSEQKGKHYSDLCRTNLSELLNNGAFMFYMCPFSCNPRCFWQDSHLESAEEIAYCVYHCFWTILHRHGSVARSIVLLEHKGVFLVPKHLFYWCQQISTDEVNVRILVDISINHYQIANARKLMHPQTITGTFLRSRNRIASGFILYQL